MKPLSFVSSSLLVLLGVVAACDTDPTVPDRGCKATASCPLGELCDTTQGACVPEPQDGFAGFFSCVLYDDASHPLDSNGLPSTSDVVGTLGPTRYKFYLDAGCMLFTKQKPPVLSVSFDAIALGDDSDTLSLSLAWPASNKVTIARATFDDQVGSGELVGDRLSDKTYALRLGFLTGGHLVFNDPLVVGSVVTGYLDVTAAATPAAQPPLLSDCTNVGVAACGPSPGAACSSLGKGGTHSVCTFPCLGQADCSPYGGLCDLALGACTKECGNAAVCPTWLSCSQPSGLTQSVCN
jgi:hypothetical protein